MDVQKFEGRKRDHLRHALNPGHQASDRSGLDRVHLAHNALPEIDFEEVHLSSACFDQSLATPFYIAGMTAGHPDAAKLNLIMAEASAARGWAFGVGSQRRELEEGAAEDWTELRKRATGTVLIANLGLSQIINATSMQVARLIQALGANAIAIHLNCLQEALQPEGTPRFRGGFEAIRRIVRDLGMPVVAKETGCGMTEEALKRLSDAGVMAVDVSGLGGTHWGRVEGARAAETDAKSLQALAAETFADWGEPLVDSVRAARAGYGDRPSTPAIWASGGVRSGLDAAKLIALGAHRVGYAKPALEAALESEAALVAWMERQEYELKVALFCTGCEDLAALRKRGAAGGVSVR